MERKAASGIMLALLLIGMLMVTFNIQPVEAQTREVGVKVGDWAKYEVAYNYTTNDPLPLFGFPPDFASLKYFKTEVLSVTETNITFQTSMYFKNGVEVSNVMWMDISSNLKAPPPFFTEAILFIAANLTVGDRLSPNPMSPLVNATLMRTYAGAEREINFVYHMSHINAIRFIPRAEFSIDTNTYMFWDRESGILVEGNKTETVTNISQGYLTQIFSKMKMIETNIWSSFISAEVCVNPKSLNLRSQGKWITAYIQLPEGYSAADINASTILLNGTIPPELDPKYGFVKDPSGYLIDYNNDAILERMVKFDRAAIESFIISQGIGYGNAALTITGKLHDGTPFEGTDTIIVNKPFRLYYRR